MPSSASASLRSSADSPSLPSLIPPPSRSSAFASLSLPSGAASKPQATQLSAAVTTASPRAQLSAVAAAADSAPRSLSLPASSSSPSSSLAGSGSAGSDPSDDVLAEEGLQPSWSAWLPAASPASQSYGGYVDVCSRSLPRRVLDALSRCSPYPSPGHDDPFPTLRSSASAAEDAAFVLMQRSDSRYGLSQHKLVARRRIREREVLGFVAGHLCTEADAEREGVGGGGSSAPSHIRIDRGYLSKYYEYEGGEAVVLSMRRFHNALQLMRDPALFLSDLDEKRPELETYNCTIDVAFDPQAGLPVLVAFAWVDIDAGQELLAFLSLGRWYSRDHKRLFIASRLNHWMHRRVAAMEQLLTQHGVDFSSQTATQPQESSADGEEGQQRNKHKKKKRKAAGERREEQAREDSGSLAGGQPPQPSSSDEQRASPVLSAVEEWRFLGDEGDRDAAIVRFHSAQSGRRGLERVELYAAFALSKCMYVKKVFVGRSVQPDVRRCWETLPDYIPPCLRIADESLPIDAAAVRQLVESGHDERLVELREVTSLISPVRYFTPPWYPAFCVVAKRPIKKGTFVFTYAGELEQEIRNRDSVYVYDMPADSVRAKWSAYPASMPDLLIDAGQYGGVARFVNDSRYRAEEAAGGAEGCCQNLDSLFVFLDHCIHLCFFTTRDVKAKEELVSHYGDEFWSVCTGQMLIDHRRYHAHISAYSQQLQRLIQQRGLPLPAEPSTLLEDEPVFTRKATRYACEALPSDTLPADEEWEVEAIVGVGRMWRELHYEVKWKGFDSSFNSWVPRRGMQGCEDVIAQFEAELRRQQAGDGSDAAAAAAGRGGRQRKDKRKTAAAQSRAKRQWRQREHGSNDGGDGEEERRDEDGEDRKEGSAQRRRRRAAQEAETERKEAATPGAGDSADEGDNEAGGAVSSHWASQQAASPEMDSRERSSDGWQGSNGLGSRAAPMRVDDETEDEDRAVDERKDEQSSADSGNIAPTPILPPLDRAS